MTDVHPGFGRLEPAYQNFEEKMRRLTRSVDFATSTLETLPSFVDLAASANAEVEPAVVAAFALQGGGTSPYRTRVIEFEREVLLPHAFQVSYQNFETYFLSLCRTSLELDPRPLGEMELKLQDVINAESRSALIASKAERAVRSLAYSNMRKWSDRRKSYFRNPFTEDELGRMIEVSQTRNAVVHNSQRAGEDYVSKVDPPLRRAALGDELPLDQTYLRNPAEFLREVAARLHADAAAALDAG